MRKLALLLLCFITMGCAATQFIAYNCFTSPRDCGTAVSVATQNKVLVFVPSPCGGPANPNKPYLVSGWVREKDMNHLTVVCNPNCSNCRIEVKK